MIRTLAFLLLAALPPAQEPQPLQRVCVLGASMSNGMEPGEDFANVLDATLRRDHDAVRSKTNLMFFASPIETAEEQIAYASESEATLIVGVDFLFWLGYGLKNAHGRPLASEKERLALLDKGLSLLEPFECPLVLGDFPDMSDAIGSMLLEAQVPAPETRAALNARLREWAAERKHVVVLPLDEMMSKLRAGKEVTIGRHTWPADSTDVLLRPDRLHPTVEGQVAIAHLVAHELVRAGLVSADEVELDLAAVFERLGEPVPEEVGG